jgi:hypothetical protein
MDDVVRSEEQHPPPEVHNFYRLHNGTDVTVLQVLTCLLVMKSKYNISNQYYNDIIKLITDLILMKHNMLKDLYQCKKIVADLDMNFKKIDVCKKNYMLF